VTANVVRKLSDLIEPDDYKICLIYDVALGRQCADAALVKAVHVLICAELVRSTSW
jgi:hypothetical protein